MSQDIQETKSLSAKIYTYLFTFLVFIWFSVILAIAVNVFSNTVVLPDPWTTNLKKATGWLFQNLLFTIPMGIILLLLTLLFYQASRLVGKTAQKASDKELRRRYLKRMILETELLTLRGIPASLISESVRLDEVFIPVQLRPNRPRTDYPLTDKELEDYRQQVKSGKYARDLDRIMVEAERDWQHIHKKIDRISIADFWERLSDEQPVAVIQGYPGMGKSTLMERLTLHMARRSLNLADPDMPESERFGKPLIPILLRLGEYAAEREKNSALALKDYLPVVFNELGVSASYACILHLFERSFCLVMLDGLDEVSDSQMRAEVQAAIRNFIAEYRNKGVGNRFLLTSRVAGYDRAAFPDYLHYTIAELNSEQVDYFLPRWCRANIQRDHARTPHSLDSNASFAEQEDALTTEIERRVKSLKKALGENQGVRELAENPLLLTLLLVMQQNSIAFPRQRIELYDIVTRTLLENRNIARNLEPIPESQAIQRLGPLAFHMQDEGNSFTRESDVMDSLWQTIGSSEGGTPEDVEREAQHFLKRIRERGGIFVQRTGDYFGFMHRTFQEYFAARHVLNSIKLKPDEEITALIKRARRKDALWREPFLLAVAYQSSQDKQVASKILRKLLDMPSETRSKEQESATLLAAEVLVESKPLSIESDLEEKVVNRLVKMYAHAQKSERFELCREIEDVTLRWLLSLPKEAYRPPLLLTLVSVIKDGTQLAYQRAVLTLLIMISMQLTAGSPAIFEQLVPPLLALAGLPAIGGFQLTPDLPISPDFTVIDLAWAVLSCMGGRGPAGALLADVRLHFKDNAEQLQQLARYSLESVTLITPVVIPLSEEKYQRYKAAVARWLPLRDRYKECRQIVPRDLDACIAIQNDLLACAEAARYPTATLLLELLQQSADTPAQWQQSWRIYLLNRLNSAHYLYYQQIALLYVMLFSEIGELETLTNSVISHYNSTEMRVKRNAERFIASLGRDLRNLRNLRDLRELRNLRELRGLRGLGDLGDLRNLIDLIDLRGLGGLEVLGDLRNLRNLRGLGALGDLGELGGLGDLGDLRGLGGFLLNKEVGVRARKSISSSDSSRNVDLLTILMGRLLQIQMGRLLQIQENSEPDSSIENEIREIVHSINDILVDSGDDEVIAAALEALSSIPARSANEIKFVLVLAEGATDERVQKAYISSLRDARPKKDDPEAWQALELGRQSGVVEVREAVEKVLEWEKRFK